MGSSTWLARAGIVASALVAAAPLLSQTGGGGSGGSGGNNAAFIAQLKVHFDKADLDQDTFLDKDELAKTFRGPKATAPAQGMYDDQGRLTKTYYDASKKYPDLVFLWAADTDGDDRVSWPEFQAYELKLLAAQQQQQKAYHLALQAATRSLATGSRRVGYGGNSSYACVVRQVNSVQRSMYNQQQQMMHATQNWQRMQMQAMANYQRMYQQAILQRLQMQQTMMTNYVRQQQAASHRVVQRHQNPAARPAAHAAVHPTAKKR